MASVNLSSNITRSWLLGYKFLVLSCFEFMVSYILFTVGCLVKVSLKLCFGNKVPRTLVSQAGYGPASNIPLLQRHFSSEKCVDHLKAANIFNVHAFRQGICK